MLYLALVGILQLFDERELIYELLTLGQVMLYLPPLIGGYVLASRYRKLRAMGRDAFTGSVHTLIGGLLVGLAAAVVVILLALFIERVTTIGSFLVRDMLVNASPRTVQILTANQGIGTGSMLILGIFAALGLAGAILELLPSLLRRMIISAAAWTLGIGLLSELVIQIVRQTQGDPVVRLLFQGKALRPLIAVQIFGVALLLALLWAGIGRSVHSTYAALRPGSRRILNSAGAAAGLALLLILPGLLGTFLSEVLSFVGLFVLMGLGLNIAVGLAGLLDLGYVTNFAVGAYIMAVLTSGGPLGVGPDWLTFWMVLPLCVLAAMFTGFFFALPVLRMRGDYLAIATLGFGEIIRLLALSDWLKPYIGGGQGIPLIRKAVLYVPFYSSDAPITALPLNTPERLYYLVLAFCFLTLFVMMRLDNSRIGRQWMAIREDEDAASAMGIDTTIAKVTAFTISAATGGLTGAIFATKVTAIFPNSFDLLKSVNTLSLIIIGGLGSIPGIVVGAAALIGLPELLREFAEYRLLIYGALMIFMMLTRPEGLWPSSARRRELRGDDEIKSTASAGD